MISTERIKQLREQRQLPQRKIAEALDIDSATYCKVERGERRAKKEQIPIIAKILQADHEELLALWLADKIIATIGEEKKIVGKAFKMAQEKISE